MNSTYQSRSCAGPPPKEEETFLQDVHTITPAANTQGRHGCARPLEYLAQRGANNYDISWMRVGKAQVLRT